PESVPCSGPGPGAWPWPPCRRPRRPPGRDRGRATPGRGDRSGPPGRRSPAGAPRRAAAASGCPSRRGRPPIPSTAAANPPKARRAPGGPDRLPVRSHHPTAVPPTPDRRHDVRGDPLPRQVVRRRFAGGWGVAPAGGGARAALEPVDHLVELGGRLGRRGVGEEPVGDVAVDRGPGRVLLHVVLDLLAALVELLGKVGVGVVHRGRPPRVVAARRPSAAVHARSGTRRCPRGRRYDPGGGGGAGLPRGGGGRGGRAPGGGAGVHGV